MSKQTVGVWDQLRGADVGEDGFLRQRVASGDGWTLDAAMEKPSNLETLWLDLPTNSLAKISKLPESGGFKVRLEPLTPGRSGQTRVILKNESSDYRDVFHSFAANIIARLQARATSVEALSRFLDQVHRWQSFLSKFGKKGLSEEAQQGLYGELTYFIRMCDLVPPDTAIEWWTGPAGTDQDFECGDVAVEVKTNRRAREVVTISSVRQLWVPEGIDLYIYYLGIDVRQGKTTTLNDKVNEARSRVRKGSGQIIDLENRLEQVGYLDSQAENYSATSYEVRSEWVFRVEEKFPKLTQIVVPDGLSDIHYDVELAACAGFRAQPKTLDHRLREQLP